MPNTLAHIGINIPLTKLFIKDSDTKWILLGTILPDIPWISQRILAFIFPNINLYDLRVYSIIQASLLFSIILGFSLSGFSSNQLRTFIILTLGAFFHLVADALEMKWANGVHLFAPLDWKLLNVGLFWPESIPVYTLSLFGLVITSLQFKSSTKGIRFRSPGKRSLIIIIFLIIYFVLPFPFFNSVIQANNHFVKTLLENNRLGDYVELDRNLYVDSSNGDYIMTFAKEKLYPGNIDLPSSGLISIKARFTSHNVIRIYEYKVHGGKFRDVLSILGLAVIILYWSVLIFRGYWKDRSKAVD